jgi:quercetin dioxygenase-like cupin family protein
MKAVLTNFRSTVIPCAALVILAAPIWRTTAPSPPQAARDRAVLSQALPPMNGSHLKVTLVEVTYGPGESSAAHSHPCPVVGYVIEGSLRSKVKGQEAKLYNPGESFYEPPNGVHETSANASTKKPAKFLAYFVCDRDTPLSLPPGSEHSRVREESHHGE